MVKSIGPDVSRTLNDPEKKCKILRTLAEWGHADAAVNLGILLINGSDAECKEGIQWIRKAAEAGNGSGMRNLGYCYAIGKGTERDSKNAAYWYRRSAEAGNIRAMCNLGVLYEFGNGVEQDYEEAAYWYRKSAEGNNSRAQTNLAYLLSKGLGVKKNIHEAVMLYTKSGTPRAAYNLAMMMIGESELDRDPEMVENLLKYASDKGYAKATVALTEILGDSEKLKNSVEKQDLKATKML